MGYESEGTKSSAKGVIGEAHKTLKKHKFSDISIIAEDDFGREEFHAHKDILGKGSKYFAHVFYETQNVCDCITLVFSPDTVSRLLMFLYTDNTELSNFQVATEVHYLSDKLEIDNLKQICENFIKNDIITLDNIFFKYELALSKNLNILLKPCHDFIKDNTKLILQCNLFKYAPASVVEDITKQEKLVVDSELEVIDAVLAWSIKECIRKELPITDYYKRICINKFMKHIRFLTLSVEEFVAFVNRSCILNDAESCALLLNLLSVESLRPVPNGFCDIRRPRSPLSSYIDVPDDFLQLVPNSFPVPYKRKPMRSPLQIVQIPCGIVFADDMASGRKTLLISKNTLEGVPSTHIPGYTYSLITIPSERLIKVGTQEDIVCSAHINLIRGCMIINGIVLQFENCDRRSNKEYYAILSLSSSQESYVTKEIELKLKGIVLKLEFPVPEILKSGCDLKIEVTVKNVGLYETRLCSQKRFMHAPNYGRRIISEINLRSNGTLPHGFTFLIRRIHYSTYSS